MVRVRKANVVLSIKDEEVKRYLDAGYSVIDESGEVVTEAIPTDLHTLQQAYRDNKVQIANLERGIADLRKELEKISKEKKTRR